MDSTTAREIRKLQQRIGRVEPKAPGEGGGSGSGTVTSVAMTVPAEFSIAGSPITTSGTLAVSKANQNANLVWAGPTSGAAAAPSFRALVAADILSLLQTGAAGVLFNDNFNSIFGTAGGGGGGLEFNQNASGGYTCAPIAPPTAEALGVWAIRSNAASGAASGAIYQSGPGTFLTFAFGGAALDFHWRFRINALPASGQDYQIVIGLTNARSAIPANGAFLFLDFAAGFTDFRYRTRAAGSQTDVGSGLTAAADTWYVLRIQVNAAGTEVTFTIDDANSQTLNTNVPNGISQTVCIMMYSNRISGTNDRILYLDYERMAWSGVSR